MLASNSSTAAPTAIVTQCTWIDIRMIDLELLVQPQRSLGEQSLSGMLRSRATLVSQGTPYAQQASQQITECDHVRCEVRLQKGWRRCTRGNPAAAGADPGPRNLANFNGGLLGVSRESGMGPPERSALGRKPPGDVSGDKQPGMPTSSVGNMYVCGVWQRSPGQRSKHEFKIN